MMKPKLLSTLVLLLSSVAFLGAQNESGETPIINALVFHTQPEDVLPGGLDIAPGLHAPDLPILEDADFRARMEAYLGQPLTMERLNEINRAVVAWYREEDIPLVDVILPEQDATNGVVQLLVVKSRVGDVIVEGNDWFAAQYFRSQISLQPDQTVQNSILSEDLNWINRNPFRRADVVYKPGKEFGTTDIVVRTEDRFPVSLNLAYDNTGNSFTGFDRFRATGTWGNAFGMDHTMRIGAIRSEKSEAYEGYTFGYIAPLPWRHTVSLFLSYQETSPDLNTFFAREGSNTDISLRYTLPLPEIDRLENFRHEFTAGFDYRRATSDLIFGNTNTPFDRSRTDVYQFVASYNASLRDQMGATSLTASTYLAPGGFSDFNEDDRFKQAGGASADYIYSSISLDRVTKLGQDFTLHNKLVLQLTTADLISSEQLGLGGMYTVRGYHEREVNGDYGFFLNNEIRTPSISLFKKTGIKNPIEGINDSFQGLAFFDYGEVHQKGDTAAAQDLMSAGVGLRYIYGPYASLRLDVAWPLEDSGAGPGGSSLSEDDVRGHLSLSLTF